jgi:chain length determinant protein EpsF
MATQIDVIKSASVARRVVREFKLADTPGTREQLINATDGKGTIEEWLANLLVENLDVQPARESSIISVSFRGTDPGFSAAMANAFAKTYIETSLELRLMPARQTAEWFDQQIVQLRAKVDDAQQKLTAYQREEGIVESEERLDVETRRMADLAGQIVAAQSLSYEASSRTGQNNLPEVNNNPVVQSLKVQVAQGEGKLAELSRRVGQNHPEYQRLQAEVATYKSKLISELGTAKSGVGATAGAARQRVSELSAAFERQKTKLLELKQQREEATLLARDLDNAQRIYDAALQRYGQTRMEAQSTQTDIAVLNPAVPPMKPSSPRVFLNILLSFFLGTMLGVGIGFLVELLDRRVRSGQDLLSLDIPVLAEVTQRGSRLRKLRRLFTRNRQLAAPGVA